MVTYLLRHARTAYSATYRVNGNPVAPVCLDAVGREQCRVARSELPLRLGTCLVSGFPRALETAELLLAGRSVPMVADTRLNEIDYGIFEDGPFLEYGRWLERHGPGERPPSSGESQREAILRMMEGLRGALAWPGPRLVVAHGLLLSVIHHARGRRPLAGAFFPEARYVALLPLTDDDLLDLAGRLIEEINVERAGGTYRAGAAVSTPREPSSLATFGRSSGSLPVERRDAPAPHREEDRHA